MIENDITVTFTEAEHEFLMDLLSYAQESINFIAPYAHELNSLPIDNPIVQRYSMMENIKERLAALWVDRFES